LYILGSSIVLSSSLPLGKIPPVLVLQLFLVKGFKIVRFNRDTPDRGTLLKAVDA
jgi:hypothetical protein